MLQDGVLDDVAEHLDGAAEPEDAESSSCVEALELPRTRESITEATAKSRRRGSAGRVGRAYVRRRYVEEGAKTKTLVRIHVVALLKSLKSLQRL